MSNYKTHCSYCGAKTHTYIFIGDDKFCPPCAKLKEMKAANAERNAEYIRMMRAGINPK